MHSFLKAEWPTIVSVFLFVSVIFGYFYYQELQKTDKKTDRYVMQCIHPGKGIQEYLLNTPIDGLDLQNAQKRFDASIQTTHYILNDTFTLDVRDNRIVAVEYFFDPAKSQDDDSDVCLKDIREWMKGYKETAEAIEYDGLTHHIYEGMVVIQKTVEADKVQSDASDASDEDVPQLITRNVGVIVLNT